jgi:hypothetical protein
MFRGSNPDGGKIFLTRPDKPWCPPSLLYNGYRVFPGDKADGAWRWPPTPSSAEVKESVELYLYSTSRPSWPVMGWSLPLPLPFPTICLNTSTCIPSRSDQYNQGNRLPTYFERYIPGETHYHSPSFSFISIFSPIYFSFSFTFLIFPLRTLPSSIASLASLSLPPFSLRHFYSCPCLSPSFLPSQFPANFKTVQTCGDV